MKTAIMPVVAVLIAVVFLGESPTFWQIAGGILVLSGVWISLQKRRDTAMKQIVEIPPVN